jgi:MtN3 and saliva related transmembrane protein
MKEIVAVIFGLALMGNAALFVPQALAVWRKKSDEGISLITFGGFNVLQIIAIVHGCLQHDISLIAGMIASLITCGAVTSLTLLYRMKRRSAATTMAR